MDAPSQTVQQPTPIVFILDCDNTLLDNDRVKADMDTALKRLLGESLTERFWQVYERVRAENGTVDLPQTFTAFRAELPDEETLEKTREAIMDFPFATRLFPATLATLRYLRSQGLPVIVSDGDSVYQPRKIELSGLADAVSGQWIVYTHKEDHLDEVMVRWPGRFYVMVDDKARILAETKRRAPDRFVTIHIRKGHYAEAVFDPPPDLALEDIGDLQSLDMASLRRYLHS